MNRLWFRPWRAANFSWRKYTAGWAATYASFVLFVGILFEILSPGFLAVALIFGFLGGFIPAFVIGYPLGLLIAGILEAYPAKWQQLLGYFLGLFLAMLLISQFFNPLWENLGNLFPQLIIATMFGASGAIGSLVAWHFPEGECSQRTEQGNCPRDI